MDRVVDKTVWLGGWGGGSIYPSHPQSEPVDQPGTEGGDYTRVHVIGAACYDIF